MSLSKYNAHIEPIFKSLKLLKVQDILKQQELKFYYKFENNKLPNYLQKLPFIKITSLREHDTRSQHNIHQMKSNHEYAKNCLGYNIPMELNDSPPKIRNIIYTHSLHEFAGYVKLGFLQSYQEDCTIQNCYI